MGKSCFLNCASYSRSCMKPLIGLRTRYGSQLPVSQWSCVFWRSYAISAPVDNSLLQRTLTELFQGLVWGCFSIRTGVMSDLHFCGSVVQTPQDLLPGAGNGPTLAGWLELDLLQEIPPPLWLFYLQINDSMIFFLWDWTAHGFQQLQGAHSLTVASQIPWDFVWCLHLAAT